MTWEQVALADLADIQGGIQKQPKRTPRLNAFPFLRVANVTPQGLDLSDIHEVELFGDELERLRLMRGDLLVVEGNGSPSQIGRAAVWDGSIDDCVHQNHLIRVRPRERLLPSYLGLVWNSPVVRDELTAVSSSTSGLHTLSVAKLRRIVLPLPSLAEQARVVEILENHLSRLDAANAEVARAQVRLNSLAEATLRSLVPETVEGHSLSHLLDAPLSNGRSVPSRDGGFPVLRLTALKEDGVDLAERKGGAWDRAEASRFLVARGDFLIARGNGSLGLVGRGSLLRDEPDEVAFPDTAIRARPRTSHLLPEFLDLVWNARVTRDQIERVARTSAGIYKVNQSQLKAISLPVPEITDQTRIVSALAAVQEQRRTTLRALETVAQRSAGLRRAVLAAAFEGKLTGQHTDNEVIQEMAAGQRKAM